jgi:hypothetical protein
MSAKPQDSALVAPWIATMTLLATVTGVAKSSVAIVLPPDAGPSTTVLLTKAAGGFDH